VLGVKQRTLRLLGAADGVPVLRGFIEYLADTGHYSDALAVLQAAQLGRGTIAEDPRLPAYTGLLHMVLALLDTLQARSSSSTNTNSSSSDTSSADGDAPHEQQQEEERANTAAAAPVTLPDLRDPFAPQLLALLREAFAAGAGTPRCDNLVEARRQLALAHRKPALIKSDPTVSGAAGYLAAVLGAAGEAAQGRDLLILVAQRSDSPRDWELLLRFIETFCCTAAVSSAPQSVFEDDDAAFEAAAAAVAAAAAARAAVAAAAAAWLGADPLAVLPLRRLCDMKLHPTATADTATAATAAAGIAHKSSKGKGRKRKAQQQQQLEQPKLPSRRALVRALVHQLEQHGACRPRGNDVALLWSLLAQFLGPLRARYTAPAVQVPQRTTAAQAAAAAAQAAAVWSGARGCDAPQHPLLAGLQLEWWADVYFCVHTDLCKEASVAAATAAATATAARVRRAVSEKEAAAAKSSAKSSDNRSSKARKRAAQAAAAEATDSESGSDADSRSAAPDDDSGSNSDSSATAAGGTAAAGATAAADAAADDDDAADSDVETSSGEDEPVDSEMKALASGNVLYYVPPVGTTARTAAGTAATADSAELSSDSETDTAAAASSSSSVVLRGIKPDMSALAVDPKGEFVLTTRYKKAPTRAAARAAAEAADAAIDNMELDEDTNDAAAASENASAAAAGGSASKDSSSSARVSFEQQGLDSSADDEQEQQQQQPQRKRARRSAAQFEGLRTAIDVGVSDDDNDDDDDLGLTRLFSQSQSQSVQLGMGADTVSGESPLATVVTTLLEHFRLRLILIDVVQCYSYRAVLLLLLVCVHATVSNQRCRCL
jgi:hypothetical protein